MTEWFYRRHAEGRQAKEVGPFETLAKARRFVALNIVDNDYGNRSDASRFARALQAGEVCEFKSGLSFEVVKRHV